MKKNVVLFLLLAHFVGFSQIKQSLNGEWDFKTDPYNQGEKEAWFDNSTNFDTWDKLSVPGNWDLRNEYSEYAGDAWYSNTFEVDQKWENKLTRIVFESVYNDCKIWVNGKEVGENHFGLLAFQFDISKYLNFNAPNRITLKVNNLFKRGAIWNWGGIRRPVWLELTENVRIDYQHITAIPNLVKKNAVVGIKVASTNKSDKDVNASLVYIMEKDGKVIASHTKKIKIPANSEEYIVEQNFNLSKSQVKLWHYDFPELYNSSVSLVVNMEDIQKVTDHFGVRELKVSGKKLLLNGEEIRPVGFNLVCEDRVTGNTLPFERIKEDVDMLKEFGVNFCRVSHLPLPKAYLDYLDEKGIMTIEEVALWGKDRWADPEHPMPKKWLKKMIKEKYNHPSVVGWSVGNEIGYLNANPKVMEYVKGAIEMTKSLDPNRLAVYVSHSADSQRTDPAEYSDLIMLNKYGGWGKAVDKAWEYHKKPIFMSEFGNVLNDEDPNQSYINATEMLGQMRNKDYVLGVSLWTFNDYRSFWYGRTGWATPVSENRVWGIVNTFRQKKKSYYVFKKEYAPVKDLVIDVSAANKKEVVVKVVPRAKFDIPANILREYYLKITSFDENFEEKQSVQEKLKTIFPGDKPFTVSTSINYSNASGIKTELIDPQGYSVYDVTNYFKAPEKTTITHTGTAHNGIQLFFNKSKGASSYYVKYYDQQGKEFHSDTTINNFVTIKDKNIKLKEAWDYEVIALNDAGPSKPSNKVNLIKDEDELSPIVWKALMDKDDLIVGFTSTPFDYLYDIEYGYAPSEYTNRITFKNKGVTRVPNVQKNANDRIYFRIRSRKQWGFASEWSQEIIVEKGEIIMPQPIKIKD